MVKLLDCCMVMLAYIMSNSKTIQQYNNKTN